MSKKQGLYLGRAGHLVVMADFLLRGWNAAIPEVDVGDDIYVVEDGNGSLKQVQVKTVSAKHHKDGIGFSARYTLKADQLRAPATQLFFVFLVRLTSSWSDPIIISKSDLVNEFIPLGGIPVAAKSLNVTLVFRSRRVSFRSSDWSKRTKDYAQFPIILH